MKQTIKKTRERKIFFHEIAANVCQGSSINFLILYHMIWTSTKIWQKKMLEMKVTLNNNEKNDIIMCNAI